MGEHDTRLWPVIHHYVRRGAGAHQCIRRDPARIDETATRRGQDYVTLFVDIDRARVMFAQRATIPPPIAAFADDLTAHGGDADAVSQVCIDMSPAFTKGIAENLPMPPSPSTNSTL